MRKVQRLVYFVERLRASASEERVVVKLANNIGWCDATTNAVTGCDKVSPGCKNCYAEAGTRARVLRVQGKETWGAKGERVPVNFAPVFRRLNKLCVCDTCHVAAGFEFNGTLCFYEPGREDGHRQVCSGRFRRIRLFADSNSDWLDPKWPIETLAKFLDAIRLAPNVDVLLLTKRIENFPSRLAAVQEWILRTHGDTGPWAGLSVLIDRWVRTNESFRNVWLGVSVEDQKRADERIPLLLQTPAAIRFLSVEPLLGRIDMDGFLGVKGVPGQGFTIGPDWIIVGGESGKNRRDCGVEAIEYIVQQCAMAGVPVFCKQDCAFQSGEQGRLSDHAWSLKEFPK